MVADRVSEPTLAESQPVTTAFSTEKDISWAEFTASTTFHGVKYIFQSNGSKFRRPIWFTVVLTCIIIFIWQVGIRTGDYFMYKTTVDVQVKYADTFTFPAVTICNQNTFRISKTVQWDLYDVIDEVYRTRNATRPDLERYKELLSAIDFRDFQLSTSHEKATFIDSCKWNGADCDIDTEFETVLTDLGVCYTFNGANNKTVLETSEAGEGSGLSLVINVEQYEYMRGPQNDAGIKILLHPHNERPFMKEQGFAAAPGSHTLVAMERTETWSLEPPYGTCHKSNPSRSHCQAKCRAHALSARCGCQAVFMDLVGNDTYCDIYSSLTCVREATVDLKKSDKECKCSPPCVEVIYEPRLSYAQLSKFNVERMILDHPEEKSILQDSFLRVCNRKGSVHVVANVNLG